jgi:alkylation response protein AidB-like acyl-CoA dehydrogenase
VPPPLAQSPTGARPGNVIGTGQSLPTSGNASNITPGDTASVIAPRLPDPPLDDNAPPFAFLRAARNALAAGRTGEGQEALERAESRALVRAVRPSAANQPSQQPLVREITLARDALAAGNTPRAIELIDHALRNPDARQR